MNKKPLMSNAPRCDFPGEHAGNLHEYDMKKVAETDGTPVSGAKSEKVLICEKHYPDREDPLFKDCRCRLCLERIKSRAEPRPN